MTDDALEELLIGFESLEAGTEEGDALRGCTEALVRHFAASAEDDASLLRFARAMVGRLSGSEAPAWFPADPSPAAIVEPNRALGWAPPEHRPRRSLGGKVSDALLARVQVEVIRRKFPDLALRDAEARAKARAAAKLGISRTTLNTRLSRIEPGLWDLLKDKPTDDLQEILARVAASRTDNPPDS